MATQTDLDRFLILWSRAADVVNTKVPNQVGRSKGLAQLAAQLRKALSG